MGDHDGRMSPALEDWERESYAQGSDACRNYSNLTMGVRTLAQQVSLVAAAGLGAALIGRERIDSIFNELMWITGLLLVVFAVSLFFVDWHYQSAFTAIRNHLATIEARHHLEGPWTAHLEVRTRLRDHVANYLPFLLIGYIGVTAAIYGLRATPLWVSMLVLAAAAALAVFLWACHQASSHDETFQERLESVREQACAGSGFDRSRPTAGDAEGDDADD